MSDDTEEDAAAADRAIEKLRRKSREKLCADLRKGLWPTTTLVAGAFGAKAGDEWMRQMAAWRHAFLAKQADAIEAQTAAAENATISARRSKNGRGRSVDP